MHKNVPTGITSVNTNLLTTYIAKSLMIVLPTSMLHEILDRTQKYMFWSKSFTTTDINPRPWLEESMTQTLPLIETSSYWISWAKSEPSLWNSQKWTHSIFPTPARTFRCRRWLSTAESSSYNCCASSPVVVGKSSTLRIQIMPAGRKHTGLTQQTRHHQILI